MADKIKGITIQIDGETKGLQSALKQVNSKTKSLQTELKGVESLLKMDPGNAVLIAQKQELLGKAVAETSKKLKSLKDAQNDVEAAFKRGDVGEEQYRDFQREIVSTEQKLKSLERQQKDVNNTTSKLSPDRMKKFGSMVAMGVAAIAAAVAAATAALAVFINQTVEAGSRINDLSQKLGLSAEGFQKWDYVLKQSGVDIEKLKGGMKTISKSMTDANSSGGKALRELIGSVEGLSQEEVFDKAVAAFQNMADGAEKNALALQVFGKSGQELLPILNDSAASTDALKKKAEELGFIMGDNAVKAADDFGDSLDTLKASAEGLRNNLVGSLLPALNPALDQMSAFVGGMSQKIAGADGDWDKIAEVLGEGLSTAITKIAENMPEVVKTASKIIMTLAQGLIDNLPMILNAAIQCIIAIVQGLAQAMPTLIPQITNAIVLMVDTLIQNLPLLVACAIQLVGAIAIGVVKAIPVLLASVPKLIGSYITAIKNSFGSIRKVGQDMIKGLWNGINDMSKWILDKIKGFGDSILSGIKDFFGIHSPSAVFRDEVGANLGEGMALGIEDSLGRVKTAMGKMNAVAMGGSQNTTNSYNVTINNPKPETASDSTRRTLMKVSYGLV